MSKESQYLPDAVPYFLAFAKFKTREFYEHIREYKTYPNGGYASFYRDNEVIQVLINIYHNIDEGFENLSIPEKFSSPSALVNAWTNFYNYLKETDTLFNDVYQKLGSKSKNNSDFQYPIVLTVIDEDRKSVIELLEHILHMPDVEKYKKPIKQSDETGDITAPESKVENLTYKSVPSLVFDIVIITAIHKRLVVAYYQ